MEPINRLSKIKILDAHEAQKIAAGEVVERPAHIVKELIENALDAGATALTFYFEDGGKELIRLIDNGSGMSPDDARLCCAPHATSKITAVDELPTLTTFGFRGEALASIAAVSTVQIVTKHTALETGIKLTLERGVITHESVAATNTGTDITITNLFAAIPARKKFLKTAATEWNAISHLITAYALDYPHVHITVYHNQHKTIACSPAASQKERAEQLFDSAVATRFITSEYHDATYHVHVHAIISDPHAHRYDRSNIYLFVNKRWVKNHKLMNALMRGYQGVLPAGRYPYAIISVTVPPETVDVNIHPKKEEVAFLHPRIVETCIEQAVAAKLQQTVVEHLMPAEQPFIATTATLPSFDQYTSYIPVEHAEPVVQQRVVSHYQQPVTQQDDMPLTQQSVQVPQEIATAPAAESFHLIGQLKQTYILIETHAGLMLIDQHAAHERILYEEIGKKFASPEAIQLLFPTLVTLPHDCSFTSEQQAVLQRFGIEAELWQHNQVRVSATPVYVKPPMLEAIIHELVQTDTPRSVTHKLQAMIACKAAVKARDILHDEEMLSLVERLLKCPQRLTCPHGRPTTWLITDYELERTFKRIL